MIRIGVAQIDITPSEPVWLVGYGDRDHRSEGTYQSLRAGALMLCGQRDSALLITADLIGYDRAFTAECKALIADAIGLLPRQIVLTATHTHCAPFFYPWIMPGQPEKEYAQFLKERLVEVAQRAQASAQPGAVSFARGTSNFGVNRRRPDGKGGVSFAPHPDGAMDRDLDTLWCTDQQDRPIASLTFFGCHPTSLGGYLIGGDYPGYLCRSLEEETGVPALFATGCAGNIRPLYGDDPDHFARPTFDELPRQDAIWLMKCWQRLAMRCQSKLRTCASTANFTDCPMRICQPQKPCGNLPHLQTLAAETGPPPCRRISLKVPYRTDALRKYRRFIWTTNTVPSFLAAKS